MLDEVQHEILFAIECEIGETPSQLPFVVRDRVQENPIWRLELEPIGKKVSQLDESLEGATAWWPERDTGCADVLSVIPEIQQVNIRYATNIPPPPGEKIFIYPPQFLQVRYDRWKNDLWARKAVGFWNFASKRDEELNGPPVDSSFFPWLRRMQRQAFDLVRCPVGFLWGPPGTGKTRTLGAVVASYLLQFPQSRVGVFSTTNAAVDQSIIAVDKALEELEARIRIASKVRTRCFRLGYHYIASNYENREHLLPVADPELVKKLAALEAARPDPQNASAYAAWKTAVELVRAEMRAQLRNLIRSARLAALTTARALFTFEELFEITDEFDLVVFDEASQVGLAHALALAPLGRRSLFAGDPRQLGPIYVSTNKYTRKWLENSMLDQIHQGSSNTCMLDEQSRVAQPICDVVSKTFYEGKLHVAEDCLNNPGWLAERELVAIKDLPANPVYVKCIDEGGKWSQKYGGNIRFGSATWLADTVPDLLSQMDEKDIMILTPFRAQRPLIRQKLRQQRCRVRVSTVHRAQGQEFHTIFFDPVKGDTDFLQGKEAERLINVGFSRAKARLVIIASDVDLCNAILARINSIAGDSKPHRDAIPIEAFFNRPDFPHCLLGERVRLGNIIGVVSEVEPSGLSFLLLDVQTGRPRRFKTDIVKQKFGNPSKRTDGKPINVRVFTKLPDFPHCMKGRQVNIGKSTGVVEEILDGGRGFVMRDLANDKTWAFQD